MANDAVSTQKTNGCVTRNHALSPKNAVSTQKGRGWQNKQSEVSMQAKRGWQIAYIAKKLKKDGSVTRNHALSHYITRLSDIIFKLRNAGWIIDGANDPTYNKFGEHIGTDYKYTLKKLPAEVA